MANDHWKDYYSRENIDFLGDFYSDFRKARAPIEAGFATKALGLQKGEKVLDLCCGMGHNSIYLARYGLQVCGVDYSDYSIKKARELSAKEGVEVFFWKGDAREVPWLEEFDAVVMLFNSFGYSQEDEENLKILRRIASALRGSGRFLMDILSRDFAVSLARRGSVEFKEEGGYHQEVSYQFDPKSAIFHIKRIISKGEDKREFNISQKAYTYSELDYLMKNAGLEIKGVYGGYEGGPFTIDSPNLIIIGNKN